MMATEGILGTSRVTSTLGLPVPAGVVLAGAIASSSAAGASVAGAGL